MSEQQAPSSFSGRQIIAMFVVALLALGGAFALWNYHRLQVGETHDRLVARWNAEITQRTQGVVRIVPKGDPLDKTGYQYDGRLGDIVVTVRVGSCGTLAVIMLPMDPNSAEQESRLSRLELGTTPEFYDANQWLGYLHLVDVTSPDFTQAVRQSKLASCIPADSPFWRISTP